MKITDIVKLLESESDSWHEEYRKNLLDTITSAVSEIKTIDGAKSVIRWGNFNVKDADDRWHHPPLSEVFKEFPTVKEMVLAKFDEIVNDDTRVSFIKEFAGSPILKDVINRHKKEFTKFFFDNLVVTDGKLAFKDLEIENHPHHDVILRVMIDEDHDMILGYLKTVVQQIPAATIKFDFDFSNKKGWHDGRAAIQLSEKGFVPKLYRAALIAYMLDEYSEEEDAQNIVKKSQSYKSFARSLQNAIKKMTTLTEADLYHEENSLLVSRGQAPDFFSALHDTICLLENADRVGKEIFSWFYHLPRHGQMHPEKQKFLDSFQEVLTRSGISNMLKAESIFSNGRRLRDLAYFD